MIAAHFPPVRISSGLQRTLRFAEYLLEKGWEPVVLTMDPRVYGAANVDETSLVDTRIKVVRSKAFDVAKSASVYGRYPKWLALPDRWSSWWLSGVSAGRRILRGSHVDVIWSTYPIATAHLIGSSLNGYQGTPWIADFRDSMTEDEYPGDRTVRRVYRKIEKKAVKNADACVFTTDGTLGMYETRYPEQERKAEFRVIENGFDETAFRAAEALGSGQEERRSEFVLVHSGTLYPKERDPEAFFAALAELKTEARVDDKVLRVVLRATGYDELYKKMLGAYGLEDVVTLERPVSYVEALGEMLEADGLLIFQSSSCNHQIPAKLYECFRAGKPILALTDLQGNTAEKIREVGSGSIVPLSDKEAIKAELRRFLIRLREHRSEKIAPQTLEGLSRRAGAEKLAGLIEDVLLRTRGRDYRPVKETLG